MNEPRPITPEEKAFCERIQDVRNLLLDMFGVMDVHPTAALLSLGQAMAHIIYNSRVIDGADDKKIVDAITHELRRHIEELIATEGDLN